MNTLDHLHWRYATKLFDPKKKVSDKDINLLFESIRLAPTSYGLQLFEVIIIKSKELKQKLYSASYDQKQVLDASHIFIFCAYNNISHTDIDLYAEKLTINAPQNKKSIISYSNSIKQNLSQMNKNETTQYTSQQTYLTLGFLLYTCSLFKIDACPMEGFDHAEYDKTLDLNSRNLRSTVIAPVGYRSEKDHTQIRMKIRKSISENLSCL